LLAWRWSPSAIAQAEYCGQHYLLKSTPEDTLCLGQECDAGQDQGACCEMRAVCSTMSCPDGEGLKRNHDELFCNSTVCTSQDAPVCCNWQNQCVNFDYNCSLLTASYEGEIVSLYLSPGGSLDAAKCDGPTCDVYDKANCCLMRASCRTITCDNTHVRNTFGLCASSECGEEDKDMCCTEKAACTTLDAASCGDTSVLKQGGELCAGSTCDADDSGSCCEPKALCSTHTCDDANKALFVHASDLYCAGATCVAADDAECCGTKGECGDGSGVCDPTTHVLKSAPAAQCDQIECTVDECCDPRQACAASPPTCPVAQLLEDGALCAGAACEDESADQALCCRALCTTMTCPASHVQIECHANVWCDKAVCSEDDDLDMCCDEKALCLNYDCQGNSMVLQSDFAQLRCADANPASCDDATCCQPVGTCAGFQHCASEEVVMDAANCAGLDCTPEDAAHCCEPKGDCITRGNFF